MNKPRLAILVSLLLAGASASAAPTEDLLRTAWKDPRLEAHDEAVQTVEGAGHLNPLSKAQLRADGGELKQEDVKLGLRLYPKGYGEQVSGSRFLKALRENEKAARSETLSSLLAARYELIARIALLNEKKGLTAEFAQASKKAGKALSYAAQKNRAEIKSYLKMKADLDKIDLKIAEVERDYANLRAELRDLGAGPAENFDLADLVSVDDIRDRLGSDAEARPKLASRIAETDLEKARAGLEYDRARDEKWLDYVEFSVKDDKQEKVYGIEIAINLPFASATDLSRLDKLAGERRDRSKSIEKLRASEAAVRSAAVELRTLLDLHKSMSDPRGRMSAEQMRKASQAVASQDPLLAVELQRGWYENREQVLDLEYRIRSLYAVYLHESSRIAEAPETNHLSKSLKRIN